MIITQSAIAMESQYRYREERVVTERLEVQSGNPPPEPLPDESAPDPNRHAVTVDISAPPKRLDLSSPLDAQGRLQMMILQHLYEAMTGRRMTLMAPQDLPRGPEAATVEVSSLDIAAVASQPAAESEGDAGMIYQRNSYYAEREAFSVATQGIVHTADGREIAISAALHMSREYVEQSSLTITAGNVVMTDPLVINFDGLGAQLDTTRFAFDLDSDGDAEQIASLRPGSGYLALDKNGDGAITNGSELFGPQTGQGFAELARHDEDGNGFIDEGDSIYHQLRIWQRHEDGSSSLMALGDVNLGAIYLGHVSTPLQLTGPGNETLGEITHSGLYIREDGSTGVAQQINLVV